MNYVIGLTGRKRSGKDTFAARLVEHHGFTRVSLADPLRELALAIDPVVEIQPDEAGIVYGPGTTFATSGVVDHARLTAVIKAVGWEKAKEIREVRRLLQVIGTDGVRNVIGDKTWIEVAKRAIEYAPGPVVVTDVRFPNEASMVEEVVGDIVRVVRPSLPDSGDLHPSETAMDDYPLHPDYVMVNDGTVEDLYAKADAFLAAPSVEWKLDAWF